ncbi:MAG: LiaF domain-containing protein [Bacteroidota bacterium]
MEINNKPQNRTGRVLSGIFLLTLGTVWLFQNATGFLDTDIIGPLFTWKFLLIVLGVSMGLRHGFSRPGWLIPLAVGSVFMLKDYNPAINLTDFIFPAILIAIALFMIFFKPNPDKWQKMHRLREEMRQHRKFARFGERGFVTPGYTPETDGNGGDDYGFPKPAAAAEGTGKHGEFLDAVCFFGGNQKRILSKNFKGADVVSLFGGTEINLMEADFKDKVVMELINICGGTKIIVPSHWNVVCDVVSVMGGMEDKRRVRPNTEVAEKTVILRGTSVMGGIEIQSY